MKKHFKSKCNGRLKLVPKVGSLEKAIALVNGETALIDVDAFETPLKAFKDLLEEVKGDVKTTKAPIKKVAKKAAKKVTKKVTKKKVAKKKVTKKATSKPADKNNEARLTEIANEFSKLKAEYDHADTKNPRKVEISKEVAKLKAEKKTLSA